MRAKGIESMDANAVEGLAAEHFLDLVHLTAPGNRLLPSAVAARLALLR
jgi:hypothetical protein